MKDDDVSAWVGLSYITMTGDNRKDLDTIIDVCADAMKYYDACKADKDPEIKRLLELNLMRACSRARKP